jgi:hypothetical protein
MNTLVCIKQVLGSNKAEFNAWNKVGVRSGEYFESREDYSFLGKGEALSENQDSIRRHTYRSGNCGFTHFSCPRACGGGGSRKRRGLGDGGIESSDKFSAVMRFGGGQA